MTIAVIGVLSTIGIASYYKIQSNVRDSRRDGQITVLSESFEKYYLKYGEYPSCSAIANPVDIKTAADVLDVADPNVFTAPTASAGTNSIICSSSDPVVDTFNYYGGSSFAIKYSKNNNSSVATVNSRHGNSASSVASPSNPVVSVILNGVNVQATITPLTCTTGTIQYGIRSRTNDGTWGTYSGWDIVTTAGQTANDGVKYGYQAQARCYVDALNYSNTAEGSEATYIDPIAAPSTPVVAANTVTDTTTWSWPAVTCAADATARYQYRYTISPSGFDSGLVSNGSNLSVAFTTSTESQTYTVAVQGQCYNANATSGWSASGSASYLRPISAPSAPSNTVILNGVDVQSTISAATCSTGTPQYSIRNRTNDGAWSAYSGWDATTVFAQFAIDGVKYGYQAQARCYIDASTYSVAAEGLEAIYIDPIDTPSAPIVAANTVGDTTTWSWSAIICIAGAASYQYDYTISPSGYDSGWVDNGTNLSVAFTTSTTGQTYVVAVQAKCSNVNTASAWSASGSAGYTSASPSLSLNKMISAGKDHTCILSLDSLVYCWGFNTYGEVGDYTSNNNRLTPTAVNTTNGVSGLYGKTVQQVVTGYFHTCALTSDGLAYCWGYNGYGEIGDNTSGINRLVPTAVNTTNGVSGLYGKTVQQIAAGYYHTCALTTDGLVYCWGSNASGEIGDNTFGTNRLAPTAVNTTNGVSGLYGKTVQQIAVGFAHTCALTTDSLAYCWGSNTSGSIGDNTSGVNRLAPTVFNLNPPAPAVIANTVSSTTTWSWQAVSCTFGMTPRYQYRYTISPSGYNSGWVNNGTNLSIVFTTSTADQTYMVEAQGQCYNAKATSSWGVSGSASYTRNNPTAIPALVPTGYITYSGTTAPTTTTVANIAHTVASYDATYFVAGLNSASVAYYDITDTPSTFNNVNSLTYNIRYKITPLAGDTETLSLRIYKSDRITPLTDSMLVKSTTAVVSETNSGNIAFTGVSTTATKADWDGVVLAIITNHTKSGGADNSVWSINEVEIGGVYQ